MQKAMNGKSVCIKGNVRNLYVLWSVCVYPCKVIADVAVCTLCMPCVIDAMHSDPQKTAKTLQVFGLPLQRMIRRLTFASIN